MLLFCYCSGGKCARRRLHVQHLRQRSVGRFAGWQQRQWRWWRRRPWRRPFSMHYFVMWALVAGWHCICFLPATNLRTFVLSLEHPQLSLDYTWCSSHVHVWAPDELFFCLQSFKFWRVFQLCLTLGQLFILCPLFISEYQLSRLCICLCKW